MIKPLIAPLSRRFLPRHGHSALAASIALLLSGAAGQAATYTYSGTTSNSGAPDLWSAGTNWDVAPLSGATTVLSYTGTLAAGTTIFSNNDLPGPFLLNSLSFTEVGPGTGTAPTITLSGSPLEFTINGSTGATLTFNTTGTVLPTVTIGNDLVLDNTLTVSATSNGTLTGIVSGVGGLTKTGAGTVTLTNANTYSGATLVNAGTLVISNAAALGNTSSITVASPGAFALSGGITAGAGKTITINGTSSSNNGALQSVGGDSTWAGSVVIGTALSRVGVGSGGTSLTISGVISAGSATANSLAVRSSSATQTVTLSGQNTYDGQTAIFAGILSVGSINSVATDATLGTVHSNASNLGAPTTVADGTIAFGSSGATAGLAATLRYTGAGETTDRGISITTGNNTSATFAATIDQSGTGVLKFTSDLTGTGATTAAKAVTLQGSGVGVFAGRIVEGTGGALSLTKTGTGSWTLAGLNNYTGTTTVSAGALTVTGKFDTTTGTATTVSGTGTLNLNNAGAFSLKTLTVSGGNLTESVANAITGGATLTVSGGTANLSQANDYNGGTTLSSGTLLIGNAGSLGSGALTINSGTLDNTSGSAITLAGNTAVSLTGNLTFTGSNALSLGTVPINLGSATRTVTVNGSTLTIGGAISGTTGTVGLTKAGAGTLLLTGANTYTGPTTISGGVLQLGIPGALASTTAVSLANTANTALDLNGNNTTIGSLTGGGTTGGNILLGAGTLTVGADNTSPAVYTGAISGSGGLIKTGTGALLLNGANTFTGGFSINSGTVQIGTSASALGAGTVTLGNSTAAANATLNLASGTPTIANPLTVANAGAGVLTLANVGVVGAKYSGAISLNHDLVLQSAATGGSLTVSGGITGTGNLLINNTGTTSTTTLGTGAINNAGTITNTGVSTGITNITGALGANVTGIVENSSSSKLLLSAANPLFTGTVTITAGTVQLNATNALNVNNVVNVSAAGTYDVGGTTSTIAGLNDSGGGGGIATNSNTTSGTKIITVGGSGTYAFSGALTSAQLGLTVALTGNGSQTLTGVNTYTGATNVNLGTLVLGPLGSMGGTAIAVGSGATPVANVSGNATLNVRGDYTLGTATAGSLTIRGGSTAGTLLGQGTLSLVDGELHTLTLANATAGNANLILGSSTAGNPALITLDAGAAGTDLIAVGQNLTVNAGGAILNFNQLSGTTLAAGNYTLLTYAGVTSGSTGSITLGTLPSVAAGKVGIFNLANTGTSQVLSVALANTGATAYWTGTESAVWNTLTTATGATNFTVNPDGSGGFVLPSASTDVFFSANSASTTNVSTTLGQNFSANSLNFTGTGTTAGSTSYTIGGSTYTLAIGAGGINVAATSANHIISSQVALAANQTWTLNGTSAQTLTVNGGISGAFTLTTAGAGTFILGGANTNSATVVGSGSTVQVTGSMGPGTLTNNGTLVLNPTGNQTIASSIAGPNGITKIGTGANFLTGASTYTGVTTLNNGVLNVQNNLGLGSTAGGTVITASNANTHLSLQGGVSIAGESLSITTNTGVDAVVLENISGNNTWSGPITVVANGNSRFQSDAGTMTIAGNVALSGPALFVLQGVGNGEISGNISGAVALTKSSLAGNTGTWVLSGTNTYSGATSIGLGTLQLGNGGTTGSLSTSSTIAIGNAAGSFAINRSNAVSQGVDFSGAALSGAGNFVQAGTGTTTLTAANTYTGTTSVTNGTLAFSTIGNVSGGSSNLGAPTTIAAGTIALGSLTNTGALLYTGTGATSDRVLNLAGTTGGGTLDASGSGLLKFTSALTATGLGNKTLTLQGTGTGELSGAVVNSTGFATSVTKAGNGTWTLSGANTYSGATSVTAGTLVVSGSISGSLAPTATVSVTGGTLRLLAAGSISNVASVSVGNGGTLALQGNSTLTGSSTPVAVASGGTLSLAGTSTVSASSLSLDNNSTLSLEIGTLTTPPITLTGTTSLTGSITLALTLTNAVPLGTTLTLIDGTAPTAGYSTGGRFFFNGLAVNDGTYINVTTGSNSESFLVNYGTTTGDITLYAVPEPSASVTLVSAVGLLLGFSRFRRRLAR